MISDAFPYECHLVDALGSQTHYVEEGNGDPILFLWARPEAGVRGEVEAARNAAVMFPNTETVFVDKGRHYVQEDQPDAIGEAISDGLGRTT